jgi:pimeloyl-ACP methyl ester carboxylesterase
MPRATVRDIRINYEVHGEGDPLLLIMGLGTGLTGWMLQIPVFSRDYQVIAFDNRGVGRTDAPVVPYSIAVMADDTVGLMDVLGIDKAHVLGKSMGGYIAQELAIRHPERVKSLMLASTGAGPYVLETNILNEWATAATEGISQKAYFQLMLPFIFTDKTFENPEMVRMALATIAANPCPTQDHALVHQFFACVEHYARGRVSQITAPTLILAGKDDFLMPLSLSEELATVIPNANLVVLEGGGHALNTDVPDTFNQAVLDFLAQIA